MRLAKLVFVPFLAILWTAGPLWAGNIREPVFAGKFYPAEAQKLRRSIQNYYKKARHAKPAIPAGKTLRALILPHAGYQYSGPTAAHAGLVLKDSDFTKVILLGPDHRTGIKNAAISRAAAYKTPLGSIPLHPDAEKLRSGHDIFRSVPAADTKEHSIEVILPFLQVFLGEFQIVPIVMGPADVEKYTSAISAVYDSSTLLVASSDLSHYLSYEKAKERDSQTIDMIMNYNASSIAADKNRACGKIPIQILLRMAKARNWEPVLLDYANSADTAGPRRQVVGYAAIAFYGEEVMTQSSRISEEKGKILVELARRSIAERLGAETHGTKDMQEKLSDDFFDSLRGTFVTLTKNGQLRGCIGSLVPDNPIREGVKENAVNAAFHDPRFPGLSKKELDQIRIEVSLLTEPRPLEYKNADDLLQKIRPHTDGVILKKGMHSATFLPQVWEQLPEKEMFLSQLCMKAGLSADAWKKGDLEILTYQVQYFEEQQ
ncbi:MAG: AmmeMemoRadiSam system protein B [Desulfosalsimonadaceae bacterium]